MSILKPDKVHNWNGLTVNQFFLTEHNPNRISMPTEKLPTIPIGTTIHNTDKISVPSTTTMAEQYTRSTYNGNMKSTRVHFYVDDKCAWWILPLTLSGWHAADGNGDGNRKTIAIEIIGNSKKAEDNGARLAAYLLSTYNQTVDKNLFTHTYWLNIRDGKSGSIDYLNTLKHPYKVCPIYIIPHWTVFKNTVKSYLDKLNGVNEPNNPVQQTEMYRVRKSWNDSKSQIGAFSNLDNAKKICKEGYSVFDSSGNVVYTNDASQNVAPSIQTTPDIYYRVYTNNRWYSEIKNCNDSYSNGYAGVENYSIRGLSAKVSKGTLKYRVHTKGGNWLGWISGYNVYDWNKGVAGIKSKEIDAIQISLDGVDGYDVQYRVSTTGSKSYLNWITGYNNTNSMGYAGSFGKPIDKIQIKVVKK